jgi:hypothetical protein
MRQEISNRTLVQDDLVLALPLRVLVHTLYVTQQIQVVVIKGFMPPFAAKLLFHVQHVLSMGLYLRDKGQDRALFRG